MNPLDAGYSAEVDRIDKGSWHELMLGFDDASFFQTWSYGAVCWGETSLSHLLLKNDGKVVAGAQLRLARIPLIRAGVAYLTSGPMWRQKNEQTDRKHLQNMVRALYNEYVVRRRLFLQVLPRSFLTSEAYLCDIYREESFSRRPDKQQTVYVDLSPSLDEIKKNVRRKWRQTLNSAEKQPIEVVVGSHTDICSEATPIIEEMKARKRYIEYGDMTTKIAVHEDLPEALKLVFALCKFEGNAVAVVGWFPGGTVGLPLVAATGNKGLGISASYPLWWKMIEYYKNRSFVCCDLGGVSAERNRGGYVFKTGLAGDKCEIMNYIGQFEACEGIVSLAAFRTAYSFRSGFRTAKIRINNLLNKIGRSLRFKR